MQNHNLNRKIGEEIASANKREFQPGYGIVISYDEEDNTATVLLAEPGSDAPGQFFNSVPCPTTPGIQSVAPEIGRPCWVSFRDGLQSSPVITHFFHHSHADMEYDQQYYAINSTPRFLMDL